MRIAREKVENIKSEQKIRRTIKSNFLPAVNYKLRSGEQVFAFSEARKRLLSGLRVGNVNGKNMWMNDENRILKLSITQVVRKFDCGKESDDLMVLIRSLAQLNTNEVHGIRITETIA